MSIYEKTIFVGLLYIHWTSTVLGLYTFKLKGMELHQRARNHISTHRAEMFGQGSAQEKEVDMKFAAFGPNPQSIPLSNEYVSGLSYLIIFS